MAITFVQQTNSQATATSATITRPTGTAVGDVLIAAVLVFDTSKTASIAGTGWTVLDAVNNTASGNAHGVATLWRLDDGSATYTIGWGGASILHDRMCVAYTGAVGVDVHSLTAQTSTTTVFRGTTVTTTGANAMVVMVGGHANVGNATPPSGMNERVDANRLYAADVIQAAAGATGNKDAALAAGDPNIGGIVALSAPVSATVTAPPADVTASAPSPLPLVTVVPSTGSVTASAPAPTLLATVTPPPANVTASAPAPIVRATVVAPPASAAASAPAPIVAAAVVAPPASVTASAPAPSVQAAIVAPPGSAAASAPAPIPKVTVVPPAADATVSAPAPIPKVAVLPPAADATATAPAPTIVLGLGHVEIPTALLLDALAADTSFAPGVTGLSVAPGVSTLLADSLESATSFSPGVTELSSSDWTTATTLELPTTTLELDG